MVFILFLNEIIFSMLLLYYARSYFFCLFQRRFISNHHVYALDEEEDGQGGSQQFQSFEVDPEKVKMSLLSPFIIIKITPYLIV